MAMKEGGDTLKSIKYDSNSGVDSDLAFYGGAIVFYIMALKRGGKLRRALSEACE